MKEFPDNPYNDIFCWNDLIKIKEPQTYPTQNWKSVLTHAM